MNTLQVKAAAGLSVPMEHKPRTYINDSQVVTVADSTYYQRRLADGDLVLQDGAQVAGAVSSDGDKKPASVRGATNKTSGE
jgi:hypothetical protein